MPIDVFRTKFSIGWKLRSSIYVKQLLKTRKYAGPDFVEIE